MTEDDITKINSLIGFVQAAGEGKYPFGDRVLLAVAAEAEEWIAEAQPK